MQKQLNNNIFLLILVSFALLIIAGCSKSDKSSVEICFKYDKDFKPSPRKLRGTLKPLNKSTVSLSKGWGYIRWLPEEGSMIASGEVAARINLDETKKRFERVDYSLFSAEKDKEKIDNEFPQTLQEKKKAILLQSLNLEKGKYEKKWLLKGKEESERWKLDTDTKKSVSELEFAEKSLAFQKKITSKGFASPFDLKTKEIETKSKKIELDYSKRLKNKILEPPLSEELAKVNHQIEVASGELWLANNEFKAASVSFQIKLKGNETHIARTSARHRKIEKILKQEKIIAEKTGIVVYPIVWGQKFTVGSQIWSGVGFLEIVSTESVYLESVVDEQDITDVVKGAQAKIVFDSFPDVTFKGKVTSVSKSKRRIKTLKGNSKLKKFPVKVSVNIASSPIKIGSKATVLISKSKEIGIFIPRVALIKKGKDTFVKLQTAFGQKLEKVETEDYDLDWVVWKNPASDKGVILYE